MSKIKPATTTDSVEGDDFMQHVPLSFHDVDIDSIHFTPLSGAWAALAKVDLNLPPVPGIVKARSLRSSPV